ncbi:MAG: 30S ribosomal protein S11 [Candidatus Pacebacteria bacterium]|nr:30S ribosomal protein S11 [Candidatus Paceibacterota bacterium]
MRKRVEEKKEPLKKVKITKGNLYIRSTYNNTAITVTDPKGNVINWATTGGIGFKGTKKGTPFAASKVAEFILDKLERSGPKEVSIFVKGIGPGRNAVLKTIANNSAIQVLSIKDVTPIPHNGPRPPKPRRV